MATLFALMSIAAAAEPGRLPVPGVTSTPGAVPAGWSEVGVGLNGRATVTQTVSVTIALKLEPKGVAALHAELDREATGDEIVRWLDFRIDATLDGTGGARHAAVARSLRAAGAKVEPAATTGTRFVVAEMAVAVAGSFFGTRIATFRHTASGRQSICATSPLSLPNAVAEHVDFVGGIDRLHTSAGVAAGLSHRRVGVVSSPASTVGDPAYVITPAVIRDLYSLPSATAVAKGALQAIAAFNNESFLPSDLKTFQRANGLADQPVYKTIGPAILEKGTAEGELDVEYIMGVSPSIPTLVWASFGQRYDPADGKYDNEPFLKWAVNVSATKGPIPYIFSLSYQDFEDSLSAAYMTRLNTEFAGLAMRGTTIVTGSGDWGVGCAPTTKKFQADFTSSSPYVVSVGATTFPGTPGHITPTPGTEVGIGFSSGGFSNQFTQPNYQQAAVAKFLAGKRLPPSSMYNASGRGFPDVSAIGDEFQCTFNNKTSYVGGTSASSPTFAAVLSRINNARLAAGKKTLGWANPRLYLAAATAKGGSGKPAFRDIVQGSNPHGTCVGFNATAGWDPMTGLGTPYYPALLAALLQD